MSDLPTTLSIWTTLPLAVGLALDATVVATGISVSLPAVTPRHAFRLSWHFGLFQFLMPIIGWLLGRQAVAAIDGWDHWVAFALLAAVGGHMLHEAVKTDAKPAETAGQKDPTRGWSLVMLSIGTSLDALAVGLSLALMDINPWTVVPLIGVVTAALVLVGMKAGRIAGVVFGRSAEILGGLVLILIGAKILVEGLSRAAS